MSKRICEWDGCEAPVTGRSKRSPEHQAEHRRECDRDRGRKRRRSASADAVPANADESASAFALENLPPEVEALRYRQQRFALIFAALGNATEAARLAGYSPTTARQQGSRLLTNVDILAAVRALHAREEAARGDAPAPLTGHCEPP